MARLLLILYMLGGFVTAYLLGRVAYDTSGLVAGLILGGLSGFFIGVVVVHVAKGEW